MVQTAVLVGLVTLGIVLALVFRSGHGVPAAAPAATGAASPAVLKLGTGCPRLGRSKPPPAGFPKDFPLPRGTVLTKTMHSREGRGLPTVAYVQGTVPLSLTDAAVVLTRELPRKGYGLTFGDSEPPYEAESRFIGNGRTGAWKLWALPGCERAVAILVGVVVPKPPASRVG